MYDIVDQLRKRGQTASFVESMTGGAISAKMVLVSQASEVLKEAVVAYSNEAKINILKINEKDIQKYGVVSAEIATLMVLHYQAITKTDLVVSITGYAEGKEPNEAYIGAYYDGETIVKHIVFKSSKTRQENIRKAVKEVIKLIKKLIGD